RERLAAAGQLDAQEALALDGDVQRTVRALQAALAERLAGVDGGRAVARAHAGRGGAPGLLVHQVAEADAAVRVARPVRVRQVVGDGVEALLLGGHAGRRGVQSFEHAAGVLDPTARNLNAGKAPGTFPARVSRR